MTWDKESKQQSSAKDDGMMMISNEMIDTVLDLIIKEWTIDKYTNSGGYAVDKDGKDVDQLSDRACAWCLVGYIDVVLAKTVPAAEMYDYSEAIVRRLFALVEDKSMGLTWYSDKIGYAAAIDLVRIARYGTVQGDVYQVVPVYPTSLPL